MNIHFPSGDSKLKRLGGSVVIITGTGRSGKTTIGNLLGSCQNVEHVDDPWFLTMLPILFNSGEITEDICLQMFRTGVAEIFNDRVLLRSANFRPEDLSSIWKQKAPREIFERLIDLYSSSDVNEFVDKNQTILVITLTDVLPFWTFFRKAIPDCEIILVLREGLNVAMDATEKAWFSNEEHLNPFHANPYRQYVCEVDNLTYYLPYWLEIGDEERYLKLSEFGRALTYWRQMLEMSEIYSESLSHDGKTQIVNFDKLLESPRETVERLISSLGMVKTSFTEQLFLQLTPAYQQTLPMTDSSALIQQELAAVENIYRSLGMPVGRVKDMLKRQID